MNAKSIAMGVVAMVVAVVLVVTCAVPIITDSVATEDTFTNKGLFFVEGLEEGQTVTYSCDSNGVYVNNVQITGDYATGYSGGASIAYTENFVIRWGGTGPYALRGAYWAYNQNASASITFNGNGTYSGTYTSGLTTTDISGTYTEFYGLVLEKTDRIMTSSTSNKYVNGDTIINGTGLTNCTNIGSFIVFNIDGTVDDGITVTGYSQTNGSELSTLTYSNVSINKTEVSGYKDLYNVTSVTFDVTDTNEKTDSVTYTVFTIPTEVTAERSVHVDGPTGDILAVIPILMVLGIVIGAVALFLTTRRD